MRKPRVYYNEHDAQAFDWLCALIDAGVLPDGEVDERDIQDVCPHDLRGFDRCHFFAGIGGWEYALQLAQWPDDRAVWTGSCPCQPFSSAGAQKGCADDRHLWPYWARLIRECRPPVIFGEQVENAIAHGWLDAVCDDLEREGYACGAACVPAASVGAPHIRQRIWFVAESQSARGREDVGAIRSGPYERVQHAQRKDIGRAVIKTGRTSDCGPAGEVADAELSSAARFREHSGTSQARPKNILATAGSGWTSELGYADSAGWERGAESSLRRARRREERPTIRQPGGSPWSDCDWLPCRDGKARPAQPGIFPLVDGLPRGVVPSGDPGASNYADATSEGRVMRLRGYGNAIVPQVAAEFIRAYLATATVESPRGRTPTR